MLQNHNNNLNELVHVWEACTANLCIAFHDGPVMDILAAPHISSTVLSIGGRIWAIWKAVDLVKYVGLSMSFYSVYKEFNSGRSRARITTTTSCHPIRFVVAMAILRVSYWIGRRPSGDLGYSHFNFETSKTNTLIKISYYRYKFQNKINT